MLRNFADHHYSTDEGTDSDGDSIESEGELAGGGTGGEGRESRRADGPTSLGNGSAHRVSEAPADAGEHSRDGTDGNVEIKWIESKKGRPMLVCRGGILSSR